VFEVMSLSTSVLAAVEVARATRRAVEASRSMAGRRYFRSRKNMTIISLDVSRSLSFVATA
jgi:hypothetical protein